jgi:hypothetical protein
VSCVALVLRCLRLIVSSVLLSCLLSCLVFAFVLVRKAPISANLDKDKEKANDKDKEKKTRQLPLHGLVSPFPEYGTVRGVRIAKR